MKDLFSSHAAQYANFRPSYPAALLDFILSHTTEKNLMWDAGTGNGQTASALAADFKKIIATDISPNQIEHAVTKENIEYRIENAGSTSIENNSVDLVTVSQALHWFPLNEFYAEVRRVAKPGAVIAAWTYNLLTVDDKTNHLIGVFYHQTLHGSWEPERSWVDDGYQTIPFPFENITDPGFSITANWSIDQLAGYLGSWSAVQKFIRTKGFNPVDGLIQEIGRHWQTGECKPVRFPLFLKIGKITA